MSRSRERWSRHWYGVAVGAMVVASTPGCATSSAGTGSGNTSAAVDSRDERRVIASFADVRAVAVSRRFVFALSAGGIAIYDRAFNRWERPFSPPGGFPRGQVTVMAADQTEDAVWFGLPGVVCFYRPQADFLQRVNVPGAPEVITFDSTNPTEALVRVNGLWLRVSRSGLVTTVGARLPATAVIAATNSLVDVYRKFPALRNQQLFLFREPLPNRPQNQFIITSGAVSPDRASEVWLGTNGNGLWKVDPTFQQATPLRYGLMERGASSLASNGDGVWAGPLGTNSGRAGLTYASNDLQKWQWLDAPIGLSWAGAHSYDIALHGNRAWVATDRGVFVATLDGNAEMESITSLNGLPSDITYAVATRGNRAFVGTANGLVELVDSVGPSSKSARNIGRRWLSGIPIFALQFAGNELWVGAGSGLYHFTPDEPQSAPKQEPAMPRVIHALAWSDSLLLVATDNAVLSWALRSTAPPTSINTAPIGRVTSIAMDDRSIFITGNNGVMTSERTAPTLARVLPFAFDIPGAVLDVAISRDWVWLATASGLVRLGRQRDGAVR